MADRVKVWDVEDSKSLRRASGASDGFVDSNTYKLFVSAGNGFTDGTATKQFNRLPVSVLATGNAESHWFGIDWPYNWRHGKLEVWHRFNHAAAAASVVRIETFITGYEVPITPTSGMNATNFNITDAQDITLTTTGSGSQVFSVNVTTNTGVQDRENRNIIGCRVLRNGAHANDNYSGSVYYMGTHIEWKPELRQ